MIMQPNKFICAAYYQGPEPICYTAGWYVTHSVSLCHAATAMDTECIQSYATYLFLCFTHALKDM